MPEFPDLPDISREDAINQVIASIALEELGLSHIINAEGEKIQFALGTLPGSVAQSIEDVLATNDSVKDLLGKTTLNQQLLRAKLAKVLTYAVLRGATGATGPTGPAGAPGTQGLSLRGTVGPRGAMGPAGAQGAQGVQGAQGARGVRGAAGSVGARGAQGPAGSVGVQGEPGAPGVRGVRGAQGAEGHQGTKGVQGPAGPDLTLDTYIHVTNGGTWSGDFTSTCTALPVLTETIAASHIFLTEEGALCAEESGLYLLGFSASPTIAEAARQIRLRLAIYSSETEVAELAAKSNSIAAEQSCPLNQTAIIRLQAGDIVMLRSFADRGTKARFDAPHSISVYALKLTDV
jgi:hypothetical protein